MAIKYTKQPEMDQMAIKIYQRFPFQGLSQVTKIVIFGSEICHLATLVPMAYSRGLEI
jgi:hypothetical protein